MKLSLSKIKYILLLILISSFAAIEYDREAHKSTHKAINRLGKEKQLRAIGTGGGMMGDIYCIAGSFQFFHPVTQMEARQLLVDAVDVYLQEINSNKVVRPYLHEYPFPVKDIEIRVWIKNPDRPNVAADQIEYMSAINGVLCYDLPDKPGSYKNNLLHEETYEEAVQILQNQRKSNEIDIK